MKEELAQMAYQDATSPQAKPANRLSATRNLLLMEAQNIEREKIASQVQGPTSTNNEITVNYVKDWFYTPSEDQIRELEQNAPKPLNTPSTS